MKEEAASLSPLRGEGWGERGKGKRLPWLPHPENWRLPLVTGLILAAVTAVPYLYAYAAQPPGHVFMGFFYLGDDANT